MKNHTRPYPRYLEVKSTFAALSVSRYAKTWLYAFRCSQNRTHFKTFCIISKQYDKAHLLHVSERLSQNMFIRNLGAVKIAQHYA